MNVENPELFSLRASTIKAICKLIKLGKCYSYKDAALKIFTTCRQKKQNCGFKLDDFQKFYNQIRKFKSKLHKIAQEEKIYLNDIK